MASQKMQNTGSPFKQWSAALIANITILSFGMQTGWISPMIPMLQAQNSPAGYPLTDLEISLIASTLSFVAIFSCVIYSKIVDKFGRRVGLLSVAIPQALGWVIKLLSANPIALIVSQALCGIAAGGVFSIAPMYTREVTCDSLRGAIATVGLLLQPVGTLIMYTLGAFFDYHTALYCVCLVPILNITLIAMRAPESPAFLVKKGKIDEATETIANLYGLKKEDKSVDTLISQMLTDQQRFESLPDISLKAICADKASRRAILLQFLMMCVLDVGGNFAIVTYASVILNDSGVTIAPHLQALSFPIVMIFGGILSSLTVEKCGRKILLLLSIFFNAVPMFFLGTILLLQQWGQVVPMWIPVLSVAVCLFAYGIGILPVPYVVMGEIFSFQIRAKVTGLMVTYGWSMCFVQSMTFTNISNAIGMHTMFFIYASLHTIFFILVLIFMPETKGKCLEEIQSSLRGDSK